MMMTGVASVTGPDTKVSNYHRALTLNIDCGADVIRELIQKQLQINCTTFQTRINNSAVQNKLRDLQRRRVLNRDQLSILNASTSDLNHMDITLLTSLALNIFNFTFMITNDIETLRRKRNNILHQPKPQLEDDTLFNDTKCVILRLAKEVDADTEERFKKQMDDLKKIELVRTRTSLDLITLHGESLMVKLVETDGTKGASGLGNQVMIKHRLTQWVRYLSRILEVDVLLQKLADEGIIDEQLKKRLEQLYNYEEQMYGLVLHMMAVDDETLLKLLVCLREFDGHVADLIEGRENMEKEFGKKLKAAEKKKVRRIVSAALVTKTGSYIACEDVHIFVDEERKCPTKFIIIRECIEDAFPTINFELKDSQFHGITWKDETKFPEVDQKEELKENISDLPSDKFADYLRNKLEKVKDGLGDIIKTTVEEEVLSSKVFANLSMDQLKDIFSPGLESASIKFATGIKITFKEVQREIENQNSPSMLSNKGCLRKFDVPTGNTVYKPEIVIPETGNLIVAAHEFVLPTSRQCNNAFIAKEIVRFANACINGKKNGTIHFGIKDNGNGQGEIVGLPKKMHVEFLRHEVQNAIKSCFDVMTVDRCMRPIQQVPVENRGIVLEVDIVPLGCHLDKHLIQVKFPPKGNQRKKCFVYNNKDNQIVTIEDSKYDVVQTDFESLHIERTQLDNRIQNLNKDISLQKRLKLKKALTGGAKYVTDAYVPVICCGEITGCPDEERIRDLLPKMGVAFTSSLAVLDFDASVSLRHLIEGDKNNIRIKLAEHYLTEAARNGKDSGLSENDCVWIYANGNNELGKDRLKSDKWYANRFNGVRTALSKIRQEVPGKRCIMVFLVFQNTTEFDPMLEIARDTFTSTFVNECIIIAENDNIISSWMDELQGKVTALHNKVFVGLEWQDAVSEICCLFKPKQDSYFEFPDSRGNIVELTPKEKEDLNLLDIELIDCGYTKRFHYQEEELMLQDDVINKRCEEESAFYEGNRVTWWNLYYRNQVGHRDVYEIHKKGIKDALFSNSGEDRYEQYQIEHHPGAGGTTLGRQLLWHFSQFKVDTNVIEAYRCCIINKITKDTAEEIYRFQSFQECPNSNTKPVMALIDNGNDEDLRTLKHSLYRVAYKKGTPNELFCMLLSITRVPVSSSDKGGQVLVHHLSMNEKMWFEKKLIELQTMYGVKVNTMFAFNVLRNSFDPSFIAKTTAELMKDISMTEMKLLQSLALFCSFDSDHPIPESVFDSVMMDEISTSNTLSLNDCYRKPFGLVWTQRERDARRKENREIWNVYLTKAMQLFITHRSSDKFSCSAVSILSQPLAKAIIHYIKTEKRITFKDIVNQLIDLVETHCSETNPMSKEFVKNVCSLFKTRIALVDDQGGIKSGKFSSLIYELGEPASNESREASEMRVVSIMTRCTEVTKDPFVGQQLARFLYHIKNYDAAEDAIKRSLERKPHNSYLLDTYGQIFRSKMEFLIGIQKDTTFNNVDTVEYIKLAINAIEKFKQAQIEALSNDEDKNFNCYLMEVQTILCLLENFQNFECFVNRENFWKFLNDPKYDIQKSSFREVMLLLPELECFRNGKSGHQHMGETLRILEETGYMTRAHIVTQFTIPNNDVFLLGPREKFEYFYGSKEHTMDFEFMKGVGLKLLMKAYEQQRNLVTRRADAALYRLQHKSKENHHGTVLKEQDLLLYLGYSIIVLCNGKQKCDLTRFKNLLTYSTELLLLQRNKGHTERKYIEAYLYYALLHWLLPKRKCIESHPNTYKKMIEEWEKQYMKNLNVKSKDQLYQKRPKIYFALGNGTPGNDILDEECLRVEWRKEMKQKEGRNRKEVKADNLWFHPIFESRHQRLSGIVDDGGRKVETKVLFKENEYTFGIKTNDDCSSLSNRPVTFVMGFSWMAPTALDVRKEGNGNGIAQYSKIGHTPTVHGTNKSNGADQLGDHNRGGNDSEIQNTYDDRSAYGKVSKTQITDGGVWCGKRSPDISNPDNLGARPKDVHTTVSNSYGTRQDSPKHQRNKKRGNRKNYEQLENKPVSSIQPPDRADMIRKKINQEYMAETQSESTETVWCGKRSPDISNPDNLGARPKDVHTTVSNSYGTRQDSPKHQRNKKRGNRKNYEQLENKPVSSIQPPDRADMIRKKINQEYMAETQSESTETVWCGKRSPDISNPDNLGARPKDVHTTVSNSYGTRQDSPKHQRNKKRGNRKNYEQLENKPVSSIQPPDRADMIRKKINQEYMAETQSESTETVWCGKRSPDISNPDNLGARPKDVHTTVSNSYGTRQDSPKHQRNKKRGNYEQLENKPVSSIQPPDRADMIRKKINQEYMAETQSESTETVWCGKRSPDISNPDNLGARPKDVHTTVSNSYGTRQDSPKHQRNKKRGNRKNYEQLENKPVSSIQPPDRADMIRKKINQEYMAETQSESTETGCKAESQDGWCEVNPRKKGSKENRIADLDEFD